MDYKERIKNDLKNDKIKEIWDVIIKVFEDEGSNGIKLFIDKNTNEFQKKYDNALEKLNRLL